MLFVDLLITILTAHIKIIYYLKKGIIFENQFWRCFNQLFEQNSLFQKRLEGILHIQVFFLNLKFFLFERLFGKFFEKLIEICIFFLFNV